MNKLFTLLIVSMLLSIVTGCSDDKYTIPAKEWFNSNIATNYSDVIIGDDVQVSSMNASSAFEYISICNSEKKRFFDDVNKGYIKMNSLDYNNGLKRIKLSNTQSNPLLPWAAIAGATKESLKCVFIPFSYTQGGRTFNDSYSVYINNEGKIINEYFDKPKPFSIKVY